MTSNTPDHEASDRHETAPDDATGVPVEPVQPTSPQDVYDGDESRAPGEDSTSQEHSDLPAQDEPRTDGDSRSDAELAAEEREPYPIGSADAEPAPVTEAPAAEAPAAAAPSATAPLETARDEEIVIDYGSAQEPEPNDEPALTKPSPAEDQHPYPPQALGEPAPAADGAGAVGIGAAGTAAASGAADRGITPERSDREADAASRPVYVQAPTPPKAKGNRGFGILIGVLATLVFGALYLLALVFVVTPFSEAGAGAAPASALVDTLSSAVFSVPVIVFFLAWVLLVVILTRASWWGYVIGGFFVGLLTYAGYLAGILAANAFEVAPSQVPQFLLDHLFDAPALLAFVIAREVPIWFGVWVGKRGRAVRVRNTEAREEYERLLEAGPSARV